MHCVECGTTQGKLINSERFGKCLCSKCYQTYNQPVYPIPAYAHIEYNEKGYPICHECGKAFKKLLSHVRQKHDMNEKEYKEKHGLDRKGIICDETRQKLRKAVKKNYKKVVKKNLILKGNDTRFKMGGEGRTKAKCSPQTILRLKSQSQVFKKK